MSKKFRDMTQSTERTILRPADKNDMELIFEWRNDPFIVNRSSSQNYVTWDEHKAWFELSLNDQNRKVYIIVRDNENIGLVRFDRTDESECIISIYLLERYTGKGYGPTTIKKGIQNIFSLWDIKKIFAHAREDNPIANRVFIKAGFKIEDKDGKCPTKHNAFVYIKNKR